MSVFNTNYNGTAKPTIFFGEKLGIARYDIPVHPMLDKIVKQQRGYFWVPEEVQELNKDKDDFRKLTKHEQHIFTSNLKRQILLDSVQGRAPSEAFTPIASLPEAEIWFQKWAESETVHSYSYTHIIRNIYPNPSLVFDGINDIKEIIDCAGDISKAYDDLIWYNMLSGVYGYNRTVRIGYPESPKPRDKSDYKLSPAIGVTEIEEYWVHEKIDLYEHKRRLWKALMSVNILEGVRFYVSFACSWAFAERKLMEGNAKIIKLIARDENLHLASTQYMLKALQSEDDDFVKIAKELEPISIKMFEDAVEQEKLWAKFLFKDGSMMGLNEGILNQYIEYIAKSRMKAIDLPSKYDITQNPLPWTNKWISGKEMQDAPQEVTKSQYVIGGVKADIKKDTFGGIKL